MLKERTYFFRKLNLITDTIITGLSFLLAMLLRGFFETGSFALPEHYLRYFWLLYIATVLWPLLLNINGMYPLNRLRTIKRSAYIIIRSSLQGLLFILALLFVFKLQIVSRLLVAGFAVIATSFLLLKESAVVYYLRRLRKSGTNLKNILIAGTRERAAEISAAIEKNSFLGLNTAGILLPQEEISQTEREGQKILGSLDDIEKVLHSTPIDIVIIAIERENYRKVDDVIFHCEEEGVEIWLTATIFNVKISDLDTDDLFGIPIFIFRTTPKFSWQVFFKNIFDKVAGLMLALFSLPIIIVAALLIKLTSRGPFLFKQERRGLQGRKFILYKLRTMYLNADKMKRELQEKNIMKGPLFKLEDDPRITPIGRILRRTSIDEMPQFWNVLKGEMSLIGPRPSLPEEVKMFKGWQRRRLSMKPGITGLWQISGRSDIRDFDKLAKLDLKYIDTWSLWLDAKIFLKTIPIVLSTKGAK